MLEHIHLSLFRKYIAEAMVSTFNEINKINLDLKTVQNGDTIELIGCVVSSEIFDIMKKQKEFNVERVTRLALKLHD